MTKNVLEIIKGCKIGDKRSQNDFLLYCRKEFYDVARRYRSNSLSHEHLFQVGFTKLLLNINKCNDLQNFDRWAKRVMINAILDNIKIEKKLSLSILPEHFFLDLPDYLIFEDNDYEYNYFERLKRLNSELKKLSHRDRLIVDLHGFQGIRQKEIAKSLNLPINTIKSIYWRSIKKIIKSINN